MEQKNFEIKKFARSELKSKFDEDDDGPDVFDMNKTGIYRSYGAFLNDDECAGFVTYHISFDGDTAILTWFDVVSRFRNRGWGTELLKFSIEDIKRDFPHLRQVRVMSTPKAIPFYKRQKFVPFCGDNNLKRSL